MKIGVITDCFGKPHADGMTGDAPFSTLEDAAYVVKLTEAIVDSSKQKKWIKIDEWRK